MSSLAAIEHALTVIADQRELLGVEIAQATLHALESQYAVLRATAVAPENPSQRKQVTILFARINGLIALTDGTTGQNKHRLIQNLWQRLDSVILDYGGYIDKHTSSTVMGVFGVPSASEDDAERAIRAALDLRAELQEFIVEMSAQIQKRYINNNESDFGLNNPDAHLEVNLLERLQLQIGINSGLVLIDEVGRAAEYTVIGDSVNLASRLQQIAPPNGVLIAPNSYHLVAGIFEVNPLSPVSFKGKEELTQVYQVNGLKNQFSESAPRDLSNKSAEFFGRDADLMQITEKWHDVVTKRENQFLLLVGEAGIGKSRLVAEFIAKQDNLESVYLYFECRAEPRLRHTPFALLRDLFITTFNVQEIESVIAAREKVLRRMSDLLPQYFDMPSSWSNVVLQIIGLERDPFDDPALDPITTQHARENVIRTLVDFWSAVVTQSTGAILILEDLHWADDYSQRWLLDLVQQSQQSPLMVVGLTRPDFFESYPYWEITTQNLLGDHFHKMVLKPLSPQAGRQLILTILQRLWTVPEDLCQLILERTEGNPYYVEELIKVLIEDGVIIPDGRNWQLNQDAVANLRVPMTLIGVIQARLDNLPFPERITLQRASVLGREFWRDAIFELNRAAQRPLPNPQIAAALANLVRRDMLQFSVGVDLDGGQTYAFKQTLLRQVAYESVLLRERPLYHQQAAKWLTTYAGERLPDYAALIAGHLEQGQDAWGAAQAYELAARHAGDLSDLDGSITFNQKALLLAGDALHRLDWRLGVYRQLVEFFFMRARLGEALTTAQEMAATAHKVGDMAAQVWVLGQIAILQGEHSEFAEMLAAAQEAEQIARLLGSSLEEVDALLYQVEAFWLQKEISQALSIAERILNHRREQIPAHRVCKCLYLLGMVYLESDKIERARQCHIQLSRKVSRLTAATTEAYILADCHVSLWRLSFALKDFQQVGLSLNAACQIYDQLEYRSELALAFDGLGQMALARGDSETAVSHFQNAVDTAESIGHAYAGLTYRLNLAAAMLDLHDRRAAAVVLEPVQQFHQDPQKIKNWRYQAKLNQVLNGIS